MPTSVPQPGQLPQVAEVLESPVFDLHAVVLETSRDLLRADVHPDQLDYRRASPRHGRHSRTLAHAARIAPGTVFSPTLPLSGSAHRTRG